MHRKSQIRQFLQEMLAEKGDTRPFADDSSLLASGRLDSMNTVEILLFLERQFAIRIPAHAFQPAQLDSVDALDALISSRSAALQPGSTPPSPA